MKKRITAAVLAASILILQLALLATGCNKTGSTDSKNSGDSSAAGIVPTVYPADTVKTIKELGMSEAEYIRKNRGSASYTGNSGHKEPTLVVSPYYTLNINGQSVPVYATVTYVGKDGETALHSYAIVDVRQIANNNLNVTLTATKYPLKKAMVLPESLGVKPDISGSTITASISKYGDYSFLMNDEETDASQYNAFSLFVREYADEDAEIAAYQKQYGKENVTVYESGTHQIDYINVEKSNSVLYLRRGALLIAKGKPGYGEDTPYSEPGATTSNGWGLDRYPLITLHQRENVKIAGSGTIDAGQLGWHERRGILATFSSNIEVSGLTLLNFPEWTICMYQCSDVNIHDVRIFGYKTNSDGVAVCNSTNVTVSDCFARSGDDLFEVKTLGGGIDAISRNITFTNCTAWASKARCFGVIAEVNKDISDVSFKNCAVIYRDSTWNNKILGSLVVISSEGNGSISNITFENIEIYKDYGHAINIAVTGEKQQRTQIGPVVFRNIKYQADLPNYFNTRESGSNKIEAEFDHVTGNGTLLTNQNSSTFLEKDKQCFITFKNTVPDSVNENSGKSGVISGSSLSRSSIFSSGSKPSSGSMSSGTSSVAAKVTPVSLPADRVKSLSSLGLTESGYKAMAARTGSYAGNAGWNVSSIVVSPYYTLKINNTVVPVYASPVYVATGNTGALQSFAMVDVPDGDFYLDIALNSKGITYQSAAVLPKNLGISTKVVPSQTISARVTEYGIYTFLVSDGSSKLSQQYSFVLMVRKLVDEEAEIASYKAKYGSDHVLVYDAGTHKVDNINITQDNTVIYLRRGSLMVANHKLDIDSEEDNKNKSEAGASGSNGWGLNRYPFINAKNKNNIRITGRGTIDGGALDWHERRGMLFASCDGVVLDGINVINFSEWGFTSYCSKNVSVHNVMLLGWKTNSDAFAMCNTTNASVDMCFARTGDDMFEVKTLGASYNAVSDNITFTNCYAWGSKARTFGIVAEVEKDIRNITFRDCAVLYRDAVWDNNRLGGLVIIVETGNGNISNILFENIEVYYDYGRAINTTILRTDSPSNKISGVIFKNITYSADNKSMIKTQPSGTNSIEVTFQNVLSDGYQIAQGNYAADVLISGTGSKLNVEN